MTVLEALRDAASTHPRLVAIDDGRVELSRGEFHSAVLRLAAGLTRVAAPGKPVGVYVEGDTLFAVAALACAAAGSPFVPLDVHDPAAYTATILERTRAGAIIETMRRPWVAGESAAVRPSLRAESALFGGFPEPLEPSRVLAADDPFMLLPVPHSSGAITIFVHSQRSLLSSAFFYVDALQLTACDRILSISSQAAFARMRDLLAALVSGALDTVRDPYSNLGSVVETIGDERITVVRASPAVIRALLGMRIDLSKSATRVLRLEGEALGVAELDRFRTALPPHCRISVGFGSTETGTVAQWFVPARFDGPIVPVGRVVPGTLIDVVGLSANGDGYGPSGALSVRGPQTALGVWDGERVVGGPFVPVSGNPAQRMYESADLIRRDAAGLIFHLGRADRARTIRGRRIELGFIEAAIRSCRGVAAAAILAVVRNTTLRLTAFLVRETGGPPASRDSVRHELVSLLPAYMIPGDVRFIAAIPVTPSGEPDTDVLARLAAVPNPRRFFARTSGPEAADTAVRTAVKIWSDLLGTDSLLADQRWDEAGGDSLQLIELAARIEQRTQRAVPPRTLTADMRPSDLIERLVRGAPPVSADGGRRIVVLLPGIRGDNERLAAFRGHFGPGIRFIVPTYANWDEIVRRDASLALVVDEVVAQIVPHLDGVPAVLVGHSFGGLIAHEVARRLLEIGHEVALVGILDTDISGGPTSPAEEMLLSRSRAVTFMRDVRALGIRRAVGLRAAYHLALRVYRSRPLRRAFGHHFRRLPLPPEVAGPFDLFMMSFVREAAARAWRLRTNTASTLVFRCKKQASPAATHDLGWSAYTTVVAVEEVGGTHLSMIAGPHGERLAESLQRAVSRLAPVCTK